jgi:Zn-dependent peptidase ImmA (M78 family)
MEKYHICFRDDAQLFYDVMLKGRSINNQEELEEFEESYFAMCLLIPEKTIRSIVGSCGIEFCRKPENIRGLSQFFMVDQKLMDIRLTTLYPTDEDALKNAVAMQFINRAKEKANSLLGTTPSNNDSKFENDGKSKDLKLGVNSQ